MPQPTFFIVGAAKSGTTAIHTYLRRHPGIFLPELKEASHFATDLLRPDDPWLDRDRYLALFEDARDDQIVGEASVAYLNSEAAAENIKRFAPDARIIIMLRHPVDAMYARHSQRVFNCHEPVTDFEEMLQILPEREAGRNLPHTSRTRDGFRYRSAVRYPEQVRRYFDTFGRGRCHVALYDDLRENTTECYGGILDFLGVAVEHAQARFEVVNANKTHRHPEIAAFLKRPPKWIARPVMTLLPRSWRKAVVGRLRKANTRYEKRLPMRPETRQRLRNDCAKEIRELQDLIERDLTHWLEN